MKLFRRFIDLTRPVFGRGWVIGVVLGMLVTPSAAQEPIPVRLPQAVPVAYPTVYPTTATPHAAVYIPGSGAAYDVASRPERLSEPVIQPEDERLLEPEKKPPGRQGVFQKISFTGTWIVPPSESDLGQWDLSLYSVFGFPFFTRESPMLVTPSFEAHLLDGPNSPDLPARVYDATLEFRHLRRLTKNIAMDVAVSPGMHGDFEIDNGDAFRITGYGLGIYEWSDDLKFAVGVAYLDRDDVSFLPIGGVLYTPGDDWRFELVSPRPRIAYRLVNFGAVRDFYFPEQQPTQGNEVWVYVGGEFGGGAWAIRRESGAADFVTTRDYRVQLGLEYKVPEGLHTRFEVGYVFGRVVEYRSPTPDYDPGSTLQLRYGAAY